MAVVFDATLENAASANPQNFVFTPVGVPKGIVVLIAHAVDGTDNITGVTYGGQAMTRVRSNVDTGTVLGRCFIYFLGSGIPTGAQTVSIARTEAVILTWACVASVTAGANTTVIVDAGLDGDRANPQVTLAYGGKVCMAFCVCLSGANQISIPVDLTDQVRLHDADFGNEVSMGSRQLIAGSSDFTIGYTIPSDECAFSAFAISDNLSNVPPQLTHLNDTEGITVID